MIVAGFNFSTVHHIRYVSDHGYDGYKSVCQRKLLSGHTCTPPARSSAPCLLEWRANRKRFNTALEFTMPDGETMTAGVESWTRCHTVASALLSERGIAECNGWTVALDNDQRNGFDYVFDAISEVETPPAYPGGKQPHQPPSSPPQPPPPMTAPVSKVRLGSGVYSFFSFGFVSAPSHDRSSEYLCHAPTRVFILYSDIPRVPISNGSSKRSISLVRFLRNYRAVTPGRVSRILGFSYPLRSAVSSPFSRTKGLIQRFPTIFFQTYKIYTLFFTYTKPFIIKTLCLYFH